MSVARASRLVCALLVAGCSKSPTAGYEAIAPDTDARSSVDAGVGGPSNVGAEGDGGTTADEIVEVACGNGQGTVEAAFPGRTEQELEVGIHVAVHYSAHGIDSGLPLPGYEWGNGGGSFRDGFVGLTCSPFYERFRVTYRR